MLNYLKSWTWNANIDSSAEKATSAAAAWSETSRNFPPTHLLLVLLLWTTFSQRRHDCITEWFVFLLHTNWTAWFPSWDHERPTEGFSLNPPRHPHHHSQQWSTVLLSEASDVEMQVWGDGDTEVRLCSSLDVQLWLWFFSEHTGPHLAAGDVLDVLDANNEQRQVTLFMLSGNTQHLHLFQCWLCMLFICSLIFFEGNWKNSKLAKLKHQQQERLYNTFSFNNMDLCPVSRQSILYFFLLAPNPNAQFCREGPCDVTKCSKSLTYLPLNLPEAETKEMGRSNDSEASVSVRSCILFSRELGSCFFVCDNSFLILTRRNKDLLMEPLKTTIKHFTNKKRETKLLV